MEKVGFINARRKGNMVFLPEDIQPNPHNNHIPEVFKRLSITAGFLRRRVKLSLDGIICRIYVDRRIRFWVNIGGDFSQFLVGKQRSISPGSQARYYFQGIVPPNWGVLIQELPPGCKTSCHCHRSRDEWIIPLYGSGIARNPVAIEITIINGDIVFFAPGIYHLLENPSSHRSWINLIIVKGVTSVGDILLKEDHIYFVGGPKQAPLFVFFV